MKSIFRDKEIYQKALEKANKVFGTETSAYRSAYITKEYKKLGGVFTKEKTKSSGLKRWFEEVWVDLTKTFIKDGVIHFVPCGRKNRNLEGAYPVCRPLLRVNSNTPKTFFELKKFKELEKMFQVKNALGSKVRLDFKKI